MKVILSDFSLENSPNEKRYGLFGFVTARFEVLAPASLDGELHRLSNQSSLDISGLVNFTMDQEDLVYLSMKYPQFDWNSKFGPQEVTK
jgi:hypothetical protein